MSTIGVTTHTGPLPDRLWPTLKMYLRPYWKRLLGIQLLAFAWSIDGMIFPVIMSKIIDAITGTPNVDDALDKALPYMIAYFAMWPIVEVGYRGAGFMSARTLPYIRASIQTDLFKRIHGMDYNFLIDNQSGSLLSKVRDVSDATIRLINELVWQFNNVGLLMIVSFVILLSVHPAFAGITFVLCLTFIGVALLFNKKVTAQGARTAEARSQLKGRIVDSIGNFLAVRSFAVRHAELAAYDVLQEGERVNLQRGTTLIETVRLIYGALAFIMVGFILMGGSFYGWYHGWVTPGEIVMLNGLTVVILQRLWFICNDLPDLMQSIGAAQEALRLLSKPASIVDAPNAGQLTAPKGEIVFDNVVFGYRAENPLFNKLSVTIPAGQKVGLVGYSGGGKTSFVRLIMRLFDVREGSIKIDGQDIASVTQDSLRQCINFIPQDPELFHRTIRENIIVGKPDATDAEVHEAARRAHADGFIATLPQGLASIVGERGVKLSGGQRQRIAIARVAIRNAPILILDEATSALDSVTEVAVQDSLHDLMEGRTTIVIAHRLSTLMNMDRILVFDKGSLVEDGSVQELIAKGGVFKTLWDAQVGGFLQDKPVEA